MTTPTLTTAPVPALFLSAAQVTTFWGTQELTHASGFFFEREDRLYLVTSRHVFQDLAAGHQPNRLEVDLHLDTQDLTQSVRFSVPLYRGPDALWNQGRDASGDIDVAVIELERDQLPPSVVLHAFTAEHLTESFTEVDAGESLLVVGFPLGASTSRNKAEEAREAFAKGAGEIDMVLAVGLVKSGLWQEVRSDLKAVRQAVPQAVLKLILETCLLSQNEKIQVCQMAVEEGMDFVKTSTGFSTHGATTADVSLLRRAVGTLGVKASGGIRTYEAGLEMVLAGATRLGLSASKVVAQARRGA